MDLSKYRDLFLAEAVSVIASLQAIGQSLRSDTFEIDDLHEGFRKVHSLKSMAGTMGYDALSRFCHLVEDFFDTVRKSPPATSKPLLPVWDEAIDQIQGAVDAVQRDRSFRHNHKRFKAAVANYERSLKDATLAQAHRSEQAETPRFDPPFVNVKPERLNALVDLVSELVHTHHQLVRSLGQQVDRPLPEANSLGRGLGHLAQVVSNLQLLPMSLLTGPFPGYIRRESQKLGKQVDIEVRGGNIELDRSILSGLSEPLLHILKNALDHGIESPEERQRKNKPPEGRIVISVSRDNRMVRIDIEDDGVGIDPEWVERTAIEKGLIQPEATVLMNDRERLNLILLPGFSGKSEASMLSGRGVGLDGAQKQVQRLGGSMRVRSRIQSGTTISISLPYRLALLNGLFVRVGRHRFVLPTDAIYQALSMDAANFLPLEGSGIIDLDGATYPFVDLRYFFGVKMITRDPVRLLLLEDEETVFAIAINEVLQEEELLVLPLPPPYNRMPLYSGGTVLEDNTVVPVLDCGQLLP